MYVVDVIHSETGEVVHTVEVGPARKAERVEDGMNINLDHDKFHTRIRDAALEDA